MNANNDIQTIPYSHHFRCFPQMIGSVANQAVFMYLMDEYICRLRTGKPTTFNISVNEIAQKRNIHRNTVSKSLGELEVMKLITVSDKTVTIHSNRFVSLVRAFHSLSSTNDKKDFIEFLKTGNYAKLSVLGYRENSDGDESLISQSGNLLDCTNMYNPVQICTTSNENLKQNCTNMYNLVQICTTILNDIRGKILEKYSKREFIIEFNDKLSDSLSEEQFEYIVNIIFNNSTPQNIVFGPELFIFLHCWHCTNMYNPLHKFVQDPVQICTTVNKEININKNSEDENLKEEIEEEKEEEENENDNEDFQVNLSLMNNALSGYKQDRKRQSLPFFPAKEIEEYVSDIRNCLDRADKIYINQVWEISHELYDMDAIYDDDGTEIAPASDSIENVGVPEERLMKDILLPAFDRTQEIIEAGKIEVNGEEYNITATIESPEDFENIIDWETVALPDGINYIISSRRVRNIFGEQVMKVSGRPTREECADSMEYMKRIVMLGDDDDRYTQLTPIELAIYNFLGDHFIIDDSGAVVEPKYRNIGCTDLRLCYHELKQKGLSKDDFISVLSVDKPDIHECLNLRPCMFRAGKIRQWNQLHSYSSVIDSLEP